MTEVGKLRKLCVALSLALLVALLHAGALAETIVVEVTQISDPVLYLDDEPYLDLSGLTLQFTGGETEDGSLAQYFIDLYADETNINSVIAQKSGDVVSFFLGGMTNAYSMPMDEFEAEIGSLQGGYADGLEDFHFEEWALPGDVGMLLLDFIAENTDPAGAREIEVSLGAGETIMIETPFAGDCTQLFRDIAMEMDRDTLLSSLLASMETGYPGYAYFLRATDFRATIAGRIAQTADGESARATLTLELSQGGDHIHYALDALFDGSEDAQLIDLKYMMIRDDFTETVQINGSIDGTALDFSATIIDDGADDDGDALYDVQLQVTPGRDTASGKDSFSLTIREEYENVKVVLSGYMVERTGEARVDLALKDEYDDIRGYLAYLPDDAPGDGAATSGMIEFGGDDGYEAFKFTCAVRTFETTIDTDDFYIDPSTAVEISGMSAMEEQAALAELQQVLLDSFEKLEDASPALRGIVDGMFGFSYDEMY